MTGLLSACKEHFHCNSLYDVLGIDKKCKPTELRKAFYKMSLLYHPDRQSESAKTEATAKFQILSSVYALLSDKGKRQVYDETGIIDNEDGFAEKDFDDWVKYWQLLFPKVTTQQIDEFCESYKGSDEELNDLIGIYERSKGDMDVILETLLFASYSEETRIRNLIEQLIKDGKVEAYTTYVNEKPAKAAKRIKRAKEEAKLFARHHGKETESKDMDSLVTAITANRQRHVKESESLLDRLAEKYAKPVPKKARRKQDQPPVKQKEK